jgi:hypothetical protein
VAELATVDERPDLDVGQADRQAVERYLAEIADADRPPACRCIGGPTRDPQTDDRHMLPSCLKCGRRVA